MMYTVGGTQGVGGVVASQQSSIFVASGEPCRGHLVSTGEVAGGRQVEGVSSPLGGDHQGPAGTRHSLVREFY